MKKQITLLYLFLSVSYCLNVSNSSTKDFCNVPTSNTSLVFVVFTVIVVITGAIGNLLCIIVIAFSNKLRSQSSYHFILSLAVADLGMSIIIIPLRVDLHRNNDNFCHSQAFCVIYTFFDILFPITSALHMVIIALDRCIAISQPFLYERAFTKYNVRRYILVIWIWCIIWSGAGLINWETGLFQISVQEKSHGRFCYNYNKYYLTVMLILFIIAPLAISLVLYILILRIVMKQAKLMAQQTAGGINDRRAIRIVATVFIAFLICYVPGITFILLHYYSKAQFMEFAYNNRILYKVLSKLFHSILHYLNSCINPIIYFISGNHFRSALKDLILKLLKKPRGSRLVEYPIENRNVTAESHCSCSG